MSTFFGTDLRRHVAPNRLARDFQADAPHMKSVTDVTEFRVADQKKYLSPVMDMLTDAFKALKPAEHPVLHSAQGGQHQHRSWVSALQDRGLHQSISRKANCYDNAAMQSSSSRDSTSTFTGTTTPGSRKTEGTAPGALRTQSLAVA